MHGQYHLECFCFRLSVIDEELKKGTVILSNLSNEGMDIDIGAYKIPLPPQVDRRKIQAKKDIISGKPIYRYHDTKFWYHI